MSCQELIEALRKRGEENALTLRQEAEAEADRIRADAAERSSRVRASLGSSNLVAVREQTGGMISEARRKARLILLSAEKELSANLYAAASESLVCLRDKQYPEVFDALVNELPACKWKVVRVNPVDEGSARVHFPGAEVIADSSITAGVDVEGEDGRVRIINTFEKRLENAWAVVLPELIKDIYGKIEECGVPEKN
ncbi:MAG: V-type ATP synthase subunit E [Nitrospirae bacterium]|nr:V-type ATP synthase subunit E [Nitrospirota bacterium]